MVKVFSNHGMLNLRNKAFQLIVWKVKLYKNVDIYNEFRAAFSNAFINSADNKLLRDEYLQIFKEYASKKITWLNH